MAERPFPQGEDNRVGDEGVAEHEGKREAGGDGAGFEVGREEQEADEDEGEEEGWEESEEEEEGRVVDRKIVIVVSFGGKGEEEGRSPPPRHGADVGCQVDGCDTDLGESKRYHRRHRVCEGHAKAAVASVGGVDQRFCQQCSRFHELSQFDGAKRSCRNRLAGHNKRRRKAPPDLKADVSKQEVAVP